jgi:hypothetical protein
MNLATAARTSAHFAATLPHNSSALRRCILRLPRRLLFPGGGSDLAKSFAMQARHRRLCGGPERA